MSRHLRSQLKRLRERIGTPEDPEATGARERMVEHLNRIADARRRGGLSEELEAEVEAVRTASEARKRR